VLFRSFNYLTVCVYTLDIFNEVVSGLLPSIELQPPNWPHQLPRVPSDDLHVTFNISHYSRHMLEDSQQQTIPQERIFFH
jgi:hypothetical protein